MSAAVEALGLTKRFGGTTAVDDVSLRVEAGEVFGVLGADGAGKTTLFRMLATLLVPDDGSATVLDCDVVRDMWRLRARIGYMAGRFSLYPDLTVAENLAFFAAVFGTTVAAEAERIAPIYEQLAPFRDRRAGALSGGMKQKLALCCALVHRPEILLLDEPTTGVDAVSRREFWDLLASLRESGLTTIVSTPYMDEATRCDRIALMQHGAILVVDTPRAIAAAYDRPLLAVRAADRYATLRAIRAFAHVGAVYPFGETLHYADARADVPAERVARELAAFLETRGLRDVTVATIPPTVEDAFIARMRAGERSGAAA